MEVVLAILTGVLFAGGLFFMLHRTFIKVIIGMILFGHATNLFLFVISGLTRGAASVLKTTELIPGEPIADPVPQALILTAIVISFGIQGFVIILFKSVFKEVHTNDLDDLNTTDKIE